jgi:hypothetical protein
MATRRLIIDRPKTDNIYLTNFPMSSLLRLICLALPLVALGADEPAPSIQAVIDDQAQGWRALTAADFAPVNSAENTWSWKDGELHCTGQPVSVLRSAKTVRNLEMVVEWMHEKPAGNSGVFLWTTPESIAELTKAGKPGLPKGIEIQILDPGYTDQVKAAGRATDWFTSHGDVFAVGVKMTPFAPLSPNGSRSFPQTKPHQRPRRVEPLLYPRHQRRSPPLGQRPGSLGRHPMRSSRRISLPRKRRLTDPLPQVAGPRVAVMHRLELKRLTELASGIGIKTTV